MVLNLFYNNLETDKKENSNENENDSDAESVDSLKIGYNLTVA